MRTLKYKLTAAATSRSNKSGLRTFQNSVQSNEVLDDGHGFMLVTFVRLSFGCSHFTIWNWFRLISNRHKGGKRDTLGHLLIVVRTVLVKYWSRSMARLKGIGFDAIENFEMHLSFVKNKPGFEWNGFKARWQNM